MDETPEVTGPPIHIFIVGLGIMGVRHLTREGTDAIRSSRRVLYVDHGFGVGEHLTSLCPVTESLLGEYREGRNRLEIYRAMATRVVDAALADPPVTFAVYGHPTFFVYPSALVRAAAAALDLRVHVVPGISSFDTIMIDLGVDPGVSGLQIYEATGLLVERRQPDPEVPCLLLQVDAVETAFFTAAASRAERFQRLQDHLLQTYEADHEVASVQSSTFPLLPPRINRFPLGQLTAEMGRPGLAGTLYIPAAAAPTVRNDELQHMVYDPLHLNRITYPSS